MKIFNLPRAGGKTTRMLYASEFQQIPILCKDQNYKSFLRDKAKFLGINIPEPITVREFLDKPRTLSAHEILIDEALMVLCEIIKQIAGRMPINIAGITLSDEKTGDMVRWYDNNGHKDMPAEAIE